MFDVTGSVIGGGNGGVVTVGDSLFDVTGKFIGGGSGGCGGSFTVHVGDDDDDDISRDTNEREREREM